MRRPISELDPRYLALDGRDRMGVSLSCPRGEEETHKAARGIHRVEFWFSRPEDQGPPNHDRAPWLYAHFGNLESPEHFSVYSELGRPLEARGCWRGYFVEGVLYDALRFGGVP